MSNESFSSTPDPSDVPSGPSDPVLPDKLVRFLQMMDDELVVPTAAPAPTTPK